MCCTKKGVLGEGRGHMQGGETRRRPGSSCCMFACQEAAGWLLMLGPGLRHGKVPRMLCDGVYTSCLGSCCMAEATHGKLRDCTMKGSYLLRD